MRRALAELAKVRALFGTANERGATAARQKIFVKGEDRKIAQIAIARA